MKVCVFGAGAIGGYLAHGLASAGIETVLVARGAQLEAIRETGLRLRRDGTETTVRVAATDDTAALGPQDWLVVALKAHAVLAAAPALAPLVGPGTTIVTAMNGIPHWYFHGLSHGARPIEAIDPDGAVSAVLPPAQSLGCVVYTAAEAKAPGMVEVLAGRRFIVGAPSAALAPRAAEFAAALAAAGFDAPVSERIRDEVWMKLWGNLSFNPLSALTGETLGALATEPGLRAIARAMMVEAQAVGEAHGARFSIDVDRRLDAAATVGAHKTSMLQDLERGRPLETGALVAAVTELGRRAGIATPVIDMVLTLVEARARTLGL